MKSEITPEQEAHLETWAGQRDLLLSEISNLQTQKDKLEVENKNIANSYSDIETRAKQIEGRIIELNKKELELPALISKEIANLETRKVGLEVEVMNLSKIVKILSEQKESLEKDVALALLNFDTFRSDALSLEKVVDHVTRVSSDNTKKIDELVIGLAKSIEEIIEVNRKNVFETNVVIEKLPRMLMEAQKHGLIKNKI